MQVTDEEITFRKSELVGWRAKMSQEMVHESMQATRVERQKIKGTEGEAEIKEIPS